MEETGTRRGETTEETDIVQGGRFRLCPIYPINAARETEKDVPEGNYEERIQN